MNELTGDFLITYNPNCLEEHSDSTDFEEYDTQPALLKDNKYYFVNKKTKESVKNHSNRKGTKNRSNYHEKSKNKHSHKEYIAIRQSETIKSSRIISVENINQEPTVNTALLHNNGFNSDDQFKTQLKRSFLRHKVIPCLSIMFGRSPNKMYTIQENDDTNLRKNTSSQVQQDNWQQRGRRKFNIRQNYTVQPVHTLEGITHEFTPFESHLTHSKLPLPNEKCPRGDLSYSNSTATKSSQESDELSHYNKRLRQRFQSEIRKEYLKYHSNKFMKHQKQQCPSMQSLYQVFTTPYQEQSKILNTSSNYNSSFCPSIPSTSSGFWHYFFHRFNKKYQTQRMEMPKPCHCFDSHVESYPEEYEYCEVKQQHNLPECDSWQNIGSALPPKGVNPNYLQRTNQHERIPIPTLPVPAKKKSKSNKKVQCECYPEKGKSNAHTSKIPESSLPQAPTGGRKRCQESHSQLTDALTQKYNGEILCIHNPPCVLINGCLNLPTINEPASVNVWTAATDNRKSFLRHEKKDKKKSCEQGCQYYSPSFEVRQCQTPEYKSEKLIQSTCNHSPPCKVVRCCYKNKYDPKLNNSCIHEPMCEMIPECVIKGKQNEDVFLERRPKCTKLPTCKKNYIVLTARDSVGTQARPPFKTVCRHEPPCLMIPKCLSLVLQHSHISRSDIPYCMHQPHCEMIPACCRKSTKKDMVSVCSQYPNGCRMV